MSQRQQGRDPASSYASRSSTYSGNSPRRKSTDVAASLDDEMGAPVSARPPDSSQHGVVPLLLQQMLKPGPEPQRIKAAEVLCSFTSYTPANCLSVTRCDSFSGIAAIFQGPEASQEVAALLVANLATHEESKQRVLQECLTPLVDLLRSEGTQLRIAALVGLSNICRLDAESTQIVLESGVLPWIMWCLESDSQKEQALAALALRSIVSTDAAHAQTAVLAGVLPGLLHLAKGPEVEASLHSIWALAACAVVGPAEASQIWTGLQQLAAGGPTDEVRLAAAEALRIVALQTL